MMNNKIGSLMEISSSYIKAQCLVNGLKIGVFEYFEDEPIDSNIFCQEIGIDNEYGFRLLRSLAALGVICHHGNRDFSLSETGGLLREDNEIPFRSIILHRRKDNALECYLSEPFINMLKEGNEKTSYHLLNDGLSTWDSMLSDEEEYRIFNEAMRGMSQQDTPILQDLLNEVDWNGIETICDIGGGTGLFMNIVSDLSPKINVSVLDVPHVTEGNDLLPGIEFITGDMFNPSTIPSDQDVYSFKNVLLDWYNDDCICILSNVHEKAKEGSKLMICENIIPEVVTEENGLGVFLDIHMMTVVGGKERTLEEFKLLFEESGWEYFDMIEGENKFGKGIVLGVKM